MVIIEMAYFVFSNLLNIVFNENIQQIVINVQLVEKHTFNYKMPEIRHSMWLFYPGLNMLNTLSIHRYGRKVFSC